MKNCGNTRRSWSECWEKGGGAANPANFVVETEKTGDENWIMIILQLCEGCDIVQSDHAPQAGVAQGIFHGDLIRRRDGHQVELEEELEEEVKRRVKREHSSNQTQVRMHG